MLCVINVYVCKYMYYLIMVEFDKEVFKIKLNWIIKIFFCKNCIFVKMYVF